MTSFTLPNLAVLTLKDKHITASYIVKYVNLAKIYINIRTGRYISHA